MFKSRPGRCRGKSFLLFTLLVLLIGCSGDGEYSDVKISESPANGLTSSSFDSYYLQALIDETRNAAEGRLVEVYEKNRIPDSERISHALAEGRYEQLGNQRLAVVELSYTANIMRVTRLVGIMEDRLITISCISPQGEPVEFHSGESHCAEAVRHNFQPDR